MRVLLVDDNEEFREFLAATLQENTLDATPVGTAAEALQMADAERFDGFVVDSLIGETDGLALIQELRNSKGGRGLPAILMSDISTALARRMAQGANCQFLAKPFGPTQFVELVRALR
jgi:DNA-binding response OmpR family regulator